MLYRLYGFSVVLLLIAFSSTAQVEGCTDKAAINYDASSIVNNGSCRYAPISIMPILKCIQPASLAENSGMIFWDNLLWQINDSGGLPMLYAMDTLTNSIVRSVKIQDAYNLDWEDIAQDELNIYVGDFGNNLNGARPKFIIYKIAKSDLLGHVGNSVVKPTVIQFTYEDQPAHPLIVSANSTDWDCESMISYKDKLYLFTKQWKGSRTVLYELPKEQGVQIAVRKDSMDVGGLITGADVDLSTQRLVLTGYSFSGERFMYLLYDFTDSDFLRSNKRKISLLGPQQTESVAFINSNYIFIGSESFSILKQRLESVSLIEFFK
ncbi:MAG: hypothetical protein CK547_04010 [Chitinophagaceae bacterium]|nr:MAG: hypothetical protein CK547_04010 [Chitinophagaceae bacterium]